MVDSNQNKNILLSHNYGSKLIRIIACHTDTFELVPIQIEGDMSKDYKNRSYKEQQYAVHPNLDAVHRKIIQLDILAKCKSE